MNDLYCDEVLDGKIQVNKLIETDTILAYYHTRPYYPVHIVVIPKKSITSLITMEESDNELLLELFDAIKKVASIVTGEHGAARVITNIGDYQDSKNLHWHVVYGNPLAKLM